MSDVLGVFLDPGVDDPIDQPQDKTSPAAQPPTQEPPDPSDPPPPAEPDKPKTPEPPPAAPPSDPAAENERLRKELERKEAEAAEAKRLADFWASKATANTPPAPKAPEPPPAPPKHYTKEQIADAISNGDVEVLRDLGYVRRDDVEDIAAKAAQEQLRQQTTANQFEQRIATTYADYINPANEKFKLLQAEIESNPIYRTVGQIDQHAALEMALTVVRTREQAKAAQPPPVDYDARINRQAPPASKPTPTNAVSTVATPMQIRAAEAIGIPVEELMKSHRELKGMA